MINNNIKIVNVHPNQGYHSPSIPSFSPSKKKLKEFLEGMKEFPSFFLQNGRNFFEGVTGFLECSLMGFSYFFYQIIYYFILLH